MWKKKRYYIIAVSLGRIINFNTGCHIRYQISFPNFRSWQRTTTVSPSSMANSWDLWILLWTALLLRYIEQNHFSAYLIWNIDLYDAFMGLNSISLCCILARWPSELDLRDCRFQNKKVQCKSYEQRWRIRQWADCAFRDSRHNW